MGGRVRLVSAFGISGPLGSKPLLTNMLWVVAFARCWGVDGFEKVGGAGVGVTIISAGMAFGAGRTG